MNKEKQTILIVDDDPDMRDVLVTALNNFGFSTYNADDGDVAVELFKEKKPDIIVSDIFMPRMDGVTMMRKVREIDPDIPVILITGYSHMNDANGDKASLPNALIRKPFSLRDLLKIIEDIR